MLTRSRSAALALDSTCSTVLQPGITQVTAACCRHQASAHGAIVQICREAGVPLLVDASGAGLLAALAAVAIAAATGGLCATQVQSVISGIGPFKNIPMPGFFCVSPKALEKLVIRASQENRR